jgi:hypothetical protein
MPDLTLESLAARIEAIEKQLAVQRNTAQPRKKDWRRVAGMFTGNDYQKQIDAEGAAIREAGLTEEPETPPT